MSVVSCKSIHAKLTGWALVEAPRKPLALGSLSSLRAKLRNILGFNGKFVRYVRFEHDRPGGAWQDLVMSAFSACVSGSGSPRSAERACDHAFRRKLTWHGCAADLQCQHSTILTAALPSFRLGTCRLALASLAEHSDMHLQVIPHPTPKHV